MSCLSRWAGLGWVRERCVCLRARSDVGSTWAGLACHACSGPPGRGVRCCGDDRMPWCEGPEGRRVIGYGKEREDSVGGAVVAAWFRVVGYLIIL